MPVEFIGWTSPQVSSEIIPATGPVFSSEVLAHTARVHEAAGFDRVLIGYFTHGADGFMVGAHTAAATERLGLLLAHRPGFIAPTLAARKMATLDHLSGGRLAVHIISGGSDADQACDGDFTDHDTRYRRSDEYVGLLRRVWTDTQPFDHDGEFYRVRGGHSSIRCRQEPHIPLYGGGGSDAAINSLAPHLDTYMLWGEPLAETRDFMTRVRDAASRWGRTPRFSVSTRPILAKTDDEAWDRAMAILDHIRKSPWAQAASTRRVENVGSQRLLEVASRRDVHDTCLFAALATATGAPGNSTALVGTPETVADALVAYYELGATALLIRGYDPLNDAIDYGNALIPLVRERVAEIDARRAGVASAAERQPLLSDDRITDDIDAGRSHAPPP
jgi:alkanesulfonate monooxygenase